MNNFHTTIYAPIKVSERLPELIKSEVKEGEGTYIITVNKDALKGNLEHAIELFLKSSTLKLEPLSNRYVFTEDEVEFMRLGVAVLKNMLTALHHGSDNIGVQQSEKILELLKSHQ